MPGKENVVVTIGADRTPYQQQMQQVVAEAKVYGKHASEAFGVEGLKGERALHGQIEGFFKDISSGADIGTAAMGRLSESFRLSGATLVALAAVQFLYAALQKGYEAADKFAGAVKDSLSVTSDNSAKSVEEMGDDIAKLKEDAKATDLATMTSLEAGATVFIQSLEKLQSVSKTVNEDAREHFEIVQKEHAEQDALADQSISQENEILRLKIAGNDEAAAALQEEYRLRNEMEKLVKDGDEQAIADLQTQIDLTAQLRKEAEYQKNKKEAGSLDKQIAEEEGRQSEIGMTPEQKLAAQNQKVEAAQAAVDNYGLSLNEAGVVAKKELQLQLDKEITEQKRLQAEIADKTAAEELRTVEAFTKAQNEGTQLQAELDEAGMTRVQKIDALKKKINAEQKQAAADAKLASESQDATKIQEQKNSILRDQIKLKKLLSEESKTDDKKEMERKESEKVSSLRRVGFGHAPGEVQERAVHVEDALGVKRMLSEPPAWIKGAKTLNDVALPRTLLGATPASGGVNMAKGVSVAESSHKALTSIHQQLVELNAKIGGSA